MEPAVHCCEEIQRGQYHSAQTPIESESHGCVLAFIYQQSPCTSSSLISTSIFITTAVVVVALTAILNNDKS